MVHYSNMNKKIEHAIYILIVKFMKENYHSGDVIFYYLILGDNKVNKCAYS